MGKRKRVSDGAVLKTDARVRKAMKDLRHDVENSNQFAAISIKHDGIYRKRDAEGFQWKQIDGILLGYRIEEDVSSIFKRFIWFVTPGYKISEIPEDERSKITAAIFSEGLDHGAGEVEMFQPTDDSIMMAQEFMPMFIHEFQPGVIVPGMRKLH